MMALPLEIYLVRELRTVTEDIKRIGDDVYNYSTWVGRASRVLRYHVSCETNKGIFLSTSFSPLRCASDGLRHA
jgi:hypothetical protein